jgi:hypothetical protein
LPRTLTLKGAFAVRDQQQRSLDDHARALGFSDLASYLLARSQQQASPAQLASELATTAKVVRRALDKAGVSPSSRQVTAATSVAAVPISTSPPKRPTWALPRCRTT